MTKFKDTIPGPAAERRGAFPAEQGRTAAAALQKAVAKKSPKCYAFRESPQQKSGLRAFEKQSDKSGRRRKGSSAGFYLGKNKFVVVFCQLFRDGVPDPADLYDIFRFRMMGKIIPQILNNTIQHLINFCEILCFNIALYSLRHPSHDIV